MRDERRSDREKRNERRQNDCGYGHTRRRRCEQQLLSSLISRSRYLSSLVAMLKLNRREDVTHRSVEADLTT